MCRRVILRGKTCKLYQSQGACAETYECMRPTTNSYGCLPIDFMCIMLRETSPLCRHVDGAA